MTQLPKIATSCMRGLFLLLCLMAPTIGLSADRGVSVTLSDAATENAWGTYHALVIGINKYDQWPRLRTAVKDARVVHQLLIDKYGFHPDHTLLRIDEEASRKNIIRDIRRIAVAMKENDNLLIYYAGHGQIDEVTGDGYWIPAEGEMKESWTWVPNSLIKSLLGSDKIRAKNVIVIADSCYSGAMLRGGPSLLALAEKGYTEKLRGAAAKRSRQVISSGGVEPVADGGADGHSLFAYYLIKALRENNREVIDLENLFHTKVWKPVIDIGDQRPTVGRLKSPMDDDGQFVLLNQAWMAEQKREHIAAEKRQRDAERQALENQHRQESEQRAALALEKERLALARQKLELEKEKLAHQQELEKEKRRVESQRQDLARQQSETLLAMATTKNQPSAPQNARRDAGILKIALFPVRIHPSFGTIKPLKTIAGLTAAVENFQNLRLSHAYEPYELGPDVQPIGLSKKEAKALWVKPSFFSSPEPDKAKIHEIAKKIGIDYVFLMSTSSRLEGNNVHLHLYIIDVANNIMHHITQKDVSLYSLENEIRSILTKELRRATLAH